MDRFLTIPQVLDYVQNHYSNPKAFNLLARNQWTSISTELFLSQVKLVGLGLMSVGVKRGDPVGILAHPSPYWTIVDFAIMSIGAVSVPLFANVSEENFIFEVAQTNLKVMFVAGHEQWMLFDRNRHFFETVISMDPAEQVHHALSYNEFLDFGDAQEKKNPLLYKQVLKSIKSDDLATIVYTSGSTGVPKGVELTHYNVLGIAHVDVFKLKGGDRDRYLNILPLAHIFGRALNVFMVAWNVQVYYFNDLKNLAQACQDVKPTLIVVVPRLLEKIYSKISVNIHSAQGFKRLLGEWAFNLAQHSSNSPWYIFKHFIANLLVYKKFQKVLGGNLKIIISGGAALNPQLAHFFVNVGFPIYEGWGMTEASTVAVNRFGKRKIGTVGIPLEGMEVKIDPKTNEIIIRGPLVMRGYYRNPEMTAAVLDKEGWLHTGDKGTIDKDGFVAIIGRIKDIFKTSTGEYVVPGPIEQSLGKYPLIDMAMVIGEGKKFASCLLFPNMEILHSLKIAHQQTQQTDEEFLNGDIVKGQVNKLLEEINLHLNHWEQLHGYRFVPHPLTVESGELTPSMKIRRDIVSKKYQNYINEIYPLEAE